MWHRAKKQWRATLSNIMRTLSCLFTDSVKRRVKAFRESLFSDIISIENKLRVRELSCSKLSLYAAFRKKCNIFYIFSSFLLGQPCPIGKILRVFLKKKYERLNKF
jgi:hypothetical protein